MEPDRGESKETEKVLNRVYNYGVTPEEVGVIPSMLTRRG